MTNRVWMMVAALLAMAAPALAQTAPALAQTAPAAPAASAAAEPLKGGAFFISPMGEPFRGTGGLSGAEVWFRHADADHDGRITPAEMQADAAAFFARLDSDHDGELDPGEITHYETVIAPEIRVESTFGSFQGTPETDSDGNVKQPPYPTRLGAGRYGFLDMPEPIVTADTNLDRSITRAEFLAAAVKRLHMLDANGDGVLTRDELPTLSAHDHPVEERGRGGGGFRGHRGGHGGFGGGHGG